MQNKRYSILGFSLIEVIIYTAMVSVFAVGMVHFLWNVMGSQTKTDVTAEVLHSALLIKERITQEAREADDLNIGQSTFNLHPGLLTFTTPNGTTIFDTVLSNGVRTLRIKKGEANYVNLTSSRVNVDNFVVQNLTRDSEPDNILFVVTLSYVNPGSDPLRNKTFTFEGAVSLRKN